LGNYCSYVFYPKNNISFRKDLSQQAMAAGSEEKSQKKGGKFLEEIVTIAENSLE
jgi:hypothetical protein